VANRQLSADSILQTEQESNSFTLHPALRGIQLLLLATAMGAGGYARTALGPLQEAMRIALSLNDNEMALLQGAVVGIPVAIIAIPLGFLINRYSRVRLLFALIVLSAAGSLLTAFASSFTLLLLARCIAGVMGLATVPVVFSLLADLYAPVQRGRVMTVVFIGQVGGNSAAFALGGMLLAMTPAPDGWRWAMLWLTAPLVPVLLLMLAMREPPRRGLTIANPSARHVWHELQRHRGVIVPLVIGIILVETGIGAMLIWGAPMLSRCFDLPPDHVGTIMAAGMLASGILGPILGGLLADFCHRTGGPRRTSFALSALALLSAFASLFAFAPGIASASILLAVAMMTMLALAVMGEALFTIVIPNELLGVCMSVLVAANILFALAVAPVTVSLLSGAMGGLAMIGRALSIICVTTGLLAAVSFAFGQRHLSRAAIQ
jgi:predicted MFS family arabinose efflux permease